MGEGTLMKTISIIVESGLILLFIAFAIGVLFRITAPLWLIVERSREKDDKKRQMNVLEYAKAFPEPRVTKLVKKSGRWLNMIWWVALGMGLVCAIFLGIARITPK
jgi:hypothetical protein